MPIILEVGILYNVVFHWISPGCSKSYGYEAVYYPMGIMEEGGKQAIMPEHMNP